MLDIIGQIFTPGTYDEEGLEITPPSQLDGWHINTTMGYLEAHPELNDFVVTPSILRRVWAGDDAENPTTTVALRFDSESEALQYFEEL
jgi:hypothetical protein